MQEVVTKNFCKGNKMKKILKRICVVLVLMIIYSYVLAIENVPDNLVIFEGESISVKTLLGLNINMESGSDTVETLSNNSNTVLDNAGKTTLKVSLFDNIFLKDVNVDVLPKTTVIPLGTMAGVKLYTSGVLVVGMSEIEGIDKQTYKPYENTGIKEGDTIISVNESQITSTDDLTNKLNTSKGNNVTVKYLHDEETKECSITPVKTGKSEYKIGLWVRDSAAGVGTVTFYEPSTKTFGALGHGITDIDTNELINIASGEFVTTKVLNITKGEQGNPGKIQGTVDNQKNIGTISKNTKFGIYGQVDNVSSLNIDASKEMEVALREEIQEGKATILCSLDNQNIEEYEIEIEKIYKENNYDNKSMLIKVTDQRLLEKTGGIIQGMSGSPIIQNGKFIGAVTHVLVNNPQEGYGVFGDTMIKQAKEVK